MEHEICCSFCYGDLVPWGEYNVCEKCKTVNLGNTFSEEKVKDYLEHVQSVIVKKASYLHDLQSKHLSSKPLNNEEKEIYKTLDSFQTIRLELNFLICKECSFESKRLCELLYQLLLLSPDIERVLAILEKN